VQDRHHAGLHPQGGQGRRGLPLGDPDLRGGAPADALGLGQSTAIGIGGDPVKGVDFVDCLAMFERDPQTRRC
jgi:hypothetical protein